MSLHAYFYIISYHIISYHIMTMSYHTVMAWNDFASKVNSDGRDWGEVTDPELIEQRLKDIYELKMLTQRLSELEDEV